MANGPPKSAMAAIKGKAVLRGMHEIEELTRRSERTIKRWIAENGFPAHKIDGIWQAVQEDVLKWMQSRIGQNGNTNF